VPPDRGAGEGVPQDAHDGVASGLSSQAMTRGLRARSFATRAVISRSRWSGSDRFRRWSFGNDLVLDRGRDVHRLEVSSLGIHHDPGVGLMG
jgi:hypothetical protein